MKRKFFWLLLGVEAVAFVAANVLQASSAGVLSAVMAFPFEQVGLLLRALSLPGGVGNAAALVLYMALCLIPCAVLLVLRKKRRLCAEDGLLVLLSALLFAVLYLMINPGSIVSFFGGAANLAVGKVILGGTVYAVVCGYLVLRVLRLCFQSSTERLHRYMAVLLQALGVLFVCLIFGVCFGELLQSITALRAGNVGSEHLLGASFVFLGLRFAVDSLPYLLDVLVVAAALRLLQELHTDRYSARSVEAAQGLSRLCGKALAATVLANVAFNVLQLLYAGTLRVINSSVQIPVVSIAFVLSVLLLARFIAENKRLKDDNDMFI